MSTRSPRRLRTRLVAASALAVAVGAGTATVAAGAIPSITAHARAMASFAWDGAPWHGAPWHGAPWHGGGWSTGAWGAGPRTTAFHRTGTRAEHFHVVSTKPGGPGSIVVTGVVDAGGVETPGRAIDSATFTGGHFRIDHSAGRPTARFDAATCVGTITQHGPFEVIDATGTMASLSGKGHYTFRAIYTTAKVAGHCSHTMTAYDETINGVATVRGR